METKQVPGQPGHYYGACQLGDAKARQEWVQRIGPDRIRNVQRLRSQVMPIAQSFVDDLANLKGRQLEVIRSHGDASEVLLQMRQRAQRYLEEFEAFLSERQGLLDLAGMPLGAVLKIARQWVDEFISDTWGRSRSAQVLPDDLVASLPESVRVFYAPN
jgi:phage-related minor tail protein